MTAEDVEKARRCYETAVHATARRRKETAEPGPARIESVAFPVPEGFDYNDFLASVNAELRRSRLDLHASACPQPGQSGRIVRITDM